MTVSVTWLFLAVPCVGLQCVIVVLIIYFFVSSAKRCMDDPILWTISFIKRMKRSGLSIDACVPPAVIKFQFKFQFVVG